MMGNSPKYRNRPMLKRTGESKKGTIGFQLKAAECQQIYTSSDRTSDLMINMCEM